MSEVTTHKTLQQISSKDSTLFEWLSILVGSCPSSRQYAFADGSACCRTNKEKKSGKSRDGELCDGSTIGIHSRCCENDDYTWCPYPNCENHEDAIEDETGYLYFCRIFFDPTRFFISNFIDFLTEIKKIIWCLMFSQKTLESFWNILILWEFKWFIQTLTV